MNYGLYLSAAGLQAQQAKQMVLTNNLANAQTTGFKRDLVVMRSRANAVDEDPRMALYRLPVVQNQGGGVFATGDGIDLSQSTLESSSSQTDLALNGRGFFTVRGDNGQTLLTRDGRFLIDTQGNLVTATAGRPVLSAAGDPISVNPALPITVDPTGTITQGGGATVKLGLKDVADSRHLMKLGGNLMKADQTTDVSGNTQVLQHHLEASGVDPMIEMVNMMEGQRAFEANAKMITYQDSTMSQVNTIGRVA